MKDIDGYIDLCFVHRNNRTVAERTYREGNSRISASITDTGTTPVYFLISTGGGFIEGESYHQHISLEENAHAVVTSQAPSYIYKCENGLTTKQSTAITVGKNATLEFYLDEVVPYKNANYLQETTVDLDEGASIILTDGLTAGWSPDGSPFQHHFAGLKMTIKQNDRLLLNDFLVCDLLEDDMGEIGFFEGYRNYNSVTIIDPLLTQKHVDQFREVLASIDTDCRYGVTQIDSGVVLRVLGPNYHENRRLIWLFTNFYREEIKIFSPINLRKPDVHIR